MNWKRAGAGASAALLLVLAAASVLRNAIHAQEQGSSGAQKTPTIEEYDPKSTLVVPEHQVERAKFPFIDIHSHHWNPTPAEVEASAG